MTTTAAAYLHATRPVRRSASDVRAALHAAGAALAADATTAAVASVGPQLRRGAFLRPGSPRVETEILRTGPAAIRVTWNRNEADRWPPAGPFATRPTSRWWRTDEEETGWPAVTLEIIVEPREQGAQLAAVSGRPPGTDTSTNRIDRHLRDRIARDAVEAFLGALAALLADHPPTPTHDRAR